MSDFSVASEFLRVNKKILKRKHIANRVITISLLILSERLEQIVRSDSVRVRFPSHFLLLNSKQTNLEHETLFCFLTLLTQLNLCVFILEVYIDISCRTFANGTR
jgi:hypothetical protein